MVAAHGRPIRDSRLRRAVRAMSALLVVLAVGLAGCQRDARTPPDVAVDEPRARPPVPGVTIAAAPRPRPAPPAPLPKGTPLRVGVPELGIAAPVVPITAPGGVLTPPGDPQVLGWWSPGAEPGSRRGSALVAGHTVHTGGGALDDLEQLRRGDAVWVRTDSGRIDYDVRDVDVLGKGELAQRAVQVFDQDVRGRLVLVTCEDWNGVEYLSNVVVTASPVR